MKRGQIKPTLVIDIDGVLTPEGVKGPYRHRKPREGAAEWLRRLGLQHFIVLWTSRPWSAYRDTKLWLKEHGFRYNRILFGKPKATLYIDDKAIRWGGFGDLDADEAGNLILPEEGDSGGTT